MILSAMEHEPEKPLNTIGDYVEKFETLSAMIQHRIEQLDQATAPLGLTHPYFVLCGDFWKRLLKKSSCEQKICSLTIKKFVESKFKLACKLTQITPTAEPTPYDIRLVTTTLKKQFDHMLEQRETELEFYRQRAHKQQKS